ncbi:unnamed protein product [Durusdinium trenchii]|uniref:Endoplasmic reticulum metallopeptidase 1-like C-terminal domain-containing protein n=1 Tax=Durusdinium trenchii TaxID=1381693 RepID=A0ABP0J150_9DINO
MIGSLAEIPLEHRLAQACLIALSLHVNFNMSRTRPHLRGGLMLALSAEFTTHLRHRDVMLASSGIFLFSLLLAFMLFPYSYDRPKRVFQQHVARSEASWNLQTGEVRWQEMEHGLWTIAMDWNNVGTLKTFAPYGLPAESRPHNDSAGIYGQVPMPFPMKAFLMGGSWSPRRAPDLPSRLSLDLRAGEVQRSHYRSLHVSVRGGPQMMMVLAPASRVQQWKEVLIIEMQSTALIQRIFHWGSHGSGATVTVSFCSMLKAELSPAKVAAKPLTSPCWWKRGLRCIWTFGLCTWRAPATTCATKSDVCPAG